MWKKTVRKQPDEHPSTESLCSRAAAYCSLSEHCRQEVSDKLDGWGADDEQTELILTYLEQENYINETRYACAFVNDKVRYQGWGRQKIRYALYQKDVSEDDIDEAFSQLDQTVYYDKLRELVRRKSRELSGETDQYKFNQKLMRFLASRGFSFGDVKQVLDDIEDEDI